MSAQADLVLADGQASPVNKTFSARGASLNLAVYKDVSGGIGVGLPTVTLGNKVTEGNNGALRVEVRISIPVLETISGDAGGYTPSPKVAYRMFGKAELIAPNRATLQNRKDLRAFMANALAHAVPTAMFNDFNNPT